MNNKNFKINGSQINYFFICKTKLWLFSHSIQMEQESDTVSIGKQLHENTYKREKDYLIDNLINVDFIKKRKNIEIHEVKKTPKMEKSHEYQLLYYMYYLKNEKDINNIIGYIDYPKIRKKIKFKLTLEKEEEIKNIIQEINEIINSEIPKPKKLKICRKCAYFELCWI
ncbi:CRISPR-associated protein Cas4 [Methanobrevibacter sp.]|uniref:CRISPR-associated protein Cas4 n=1 Tax=Methanobrevibacter sp. TaxID=66852 RepID=UPI00262F2531|nr:CRISPR-associated protein Cas4 [uncultured Methanobrevibacter sp.]